MARLPGAATPPPRRERIWIGLALCAITLLSWGYLLTGGGVAMPSGMTAAQPGWSPLQTLLMFTMWWVMMFAMMIPSAAPMILLFASVAARAGRTFATILFVSGYLLVWGGFSVVATAVQWQLTQAGVMAGMRVNSHLIGGLILLAAGLYQSSPAKKACLRHCRSPMQFVIEHWQPGRIGAVRMGLRHGGYCLGCCWALMAMLFVGGVMNLAWVGVLAAFVLVEKLAPAGHRLGRAAAGLMIAAGATLLALSV